MYMLFGLHIVLGVFAVLMIVGVVIAMNAARRHTGAGAGALQEEGLGSAREAMARWFAPVKPGMSLLGPAARVAVEFGCALCGFPGLGWMASGRIRVGLLLISLGPAIVWAVYPAYVSAAHGSLPGPADMLVYLPALALVSASALALIQRRPAGKESRIDC